MSEVVALLSLIYVSLCYVLGVLSFFVGLFFAYFMTRGWY